MDVFIATPSYTGDVCGEYSSSLCETAIRLTQARIGVYHAILPGNPFLDMARNELVAKFLSTDATDLLWIDADVGWDAKVITRVLSYPQEVVGGMVPKRDAKSDSVYHQNAITGVMSPEGLFQTFELPTAFMRVKRSAFEKWDRLNPGVPYFGLGPSPHSHNPKDKGEDIWFCREWAHLGEFCWVDSDINFAHHGRKAWKGNFFEHCIATGALKQEPAPMSTAA